MTTTTLQVIKRPNPRRILHLKPSTSASPTMMKHPTHHVLLDCFSPYSSTHFQTKKMTPRQFPTMQIVLPHLRKTRNAQRVPSNTFPHYVKSRTEYMKSGPEYSTTERQTGLISLISVKESGSYSRIRPTRRQVSRRSPSGFGKRMKASGKTLMWAYSCCRLSISRLSWSSNNIEDHSRPHPPKRLTMHRGGARRIANPKLSGMAQSISCFCDSFSVRAKMRRCNTNAYK